MSRKIANFRVLLDREGMRYQFFCALSGALVCTTRPFHADASEEALIFAWETEGKKHFNHCSKCGNWVIDAMYNVDVLKCVDCAPYETMPLYCKACGTKVAEKADRCSCCGKQSPAPNSDVPDVSQPDVTPTPPVVTGDVEILSLQKQWHYLSEQAGDALLVQSRHSCVTPWFEDAGNCPQLTQTLEQSASMIRRSMEDEFDNLCAMAYEEFSTGGDCVLL